MKKFYNQNMPFCLVLLFWSFFAFGSLAQVTVAPLACYPQYSTIGEMNGAAEASGGQTPFATWKAVYDYATDNSINTIDFVAGTYFPGGVSGLSSDWGDASGGFVIPAGMTVNGNGAVIDNSANNNTIAFATIGGNNATLDGFTFVQFTGNNAGAILVNGGLTGWTISNCNFDHNDWAGDGLVVNQGAGSSGTIVGCNFYGHVQSTGSAMTVNGAGGTLDIINTVYSCNSRIVAGGAVRILGAANVSFVGCTFDGNLTNSASGGAISIEENSVASFNNTIFTCNTATVNVQDDGGAMHIIEGSNVTITGCNFTGNEAQDKGGAIHVEGASASIVTLNISSTEFHSNEAQTATSYGGAMYIDDFNAIISNNYFSGNQSVGGNTNGGGGGIFISAGNGTSSLTFNSNTFTGNTSGNGNGNAIRSELDFEGTGNSISGDIYTACTSPGPGFFNYAGDDFGSGTGNWSALGSTTVVHTSGRMRIDASDDGAVYRDVSTSPLNTTCAYDTRFDANTEVVTWTFTASNQSSLEGFDGSEDGMAFVLGANSSDFFANTTNGYAVIFDRNNGGQIELTYFTGGLNVDANHTQIAAGSGITSGGSSASVRVSYDPGTDDWTLEYDFNTNSSSDLDTDPRGNNGVCMGPAEVNTSGNDATYTGVSLDYTGFAMSGSSQMTIDYYHTRVGDGCTSGTGWSGSPAAATCSACLSTTNPANDCEDQGSISGVTWDDTDDNDGINDNDATNPPLAGVIVELFNCDGTSTGRNITTGSTGAFYFGGLADAGCFYLTFTPPGVFEPTTQDASGSTSMNDSDVNPATSQSPQITINTTPNNVDTDDDTTNDTHYVTVDAGFTTAPLPVEFSYLAANSEDCQSIIHWETASETENEYFAIEHSTDGYSFLEIGIIESLGNAASTQQYRFIDDTPSLMYINYYRLKQVDRDGHFSYSETVVLEHKDCKKEVAITNFYPNPFNDRLVIGFDAKEYDEVASIEIIDVLGNLILTEERDIIDENKITIETENLPIGVYFIRLTIGNYSSVIKACKHKE